MKACKQQPLNNKLPKNVLKLAACFVVAAVSHSQVLAQTSPVATLILEAQHLTQGNDRDNDPDNISAGNSVNQKAKSEKNDRNPIADLSSNQSPEYSITKHLASIDKLTSVSNSASYDLAEQYVGLGNAYLKAKQPEEAIKAFDLAKNIYRANEGLFTLRQVSQVQGQITAYTLLNDFNRIDNLHAYLHYIYTKNYSADDQALLEAKLTWADWNLEAYRKGYRNGYQNNVSFADSRDRYRYLSESHRANFQIPVNFNAGDITGDTSAPTTPQTLNLSVPMTVSNPNNTATNAAVTDYSSWGMESCLSPHRCLAVIMQ